MQQAQKLFGHAFQGEAEIWENHRFFFFSCIINTLFESRYSIAAERAILLQRLGIRKTEELHSVVKNKRCISTV